MSNLIASKCQALVVRCPGCGLAGEVLRADAESFDVRACPCFGDWALSATIAMSELGAWLPCEARVARQERDSHGYPWRATCRCGWVSDGYVAERAAQLMADDHVG